jgi:hypothetical protein
MVYVVGKPETAFVFATNLVTNLFILIRRKFFKRKQFA